MTAPTVPRGAVPATDRMGPQSTAPGLQARVRITPDGGTATLSIDAYGRNLSDEQILTEIGGLIGRSRITTGLDRVFLDQELPRLVARRQCFEHRVIARALAPVDGQDARLQFVVPRPTREHLIRADGTCDFKQRDLIRTVEAGELLLVRHDPVPPVDGRRLDGSPWPGRGGRDLLLVPVQNVDLRQGDGRQEAYATCCGQVVYDQRHTSLAIRVSPITVIRGDIDYHTGNLYLRGSVVIQGTVRRGFSVVASGNISIDGLIEAGAGVTAGGDLWVKGGVLGSANDTTPSRPVKAFGNLQAQYAEHGVLEAEGDIYLRSSLNASLRANGCIVVGKNLVGGTAMAARSITAGEIGNQIGIQTNVQAGVSFTTVNRLELLTRILADLGRRLEEARKNLAVVERERRRLDPSVAADLTATLQAKVTSLEEQVLKLEMKRADFAIDHLATEPAHISAATFHAGVVMLINTTRHLTREPVHHATFRLGADERIVREPYRPGSRKADQGIRPRSSAP